MPRISDARRTRQRRRFLDAAQTVLARDGLTRLSIGAVLEESGLSAGALYGYFSGKDELLSAVFQEISGIRTRGLREAAQLDPVPAPRHALHRLLMDLPQELLVSGVVLQFWGEVAHRSDLQSEASRAIADLQAALADYVRCWLTDSQGLAEGEASAAAQAAAPALLAVLQGYLVQSTLAGAPLDVDDYLDSWQSAAGLLAAD